MLKAGLALRQSPNFVCLLEGLALTRAVVCRLAPDLAFLLRLKLEYCTYGSNTPHRAHVWQAMAAVC